MGAALRTARAILNEIPELLAQALLELRVDLHVHQVRFRTREEAKTAVFEYIEIFYNRQRLHSAIGYRTPAEARASMEGITMRAAA